MLAPFHRHGHNRSTSAVVVDEYEMGPVIGIGTYGEVRCARNVYTNERVAIKIVDLSRFQEEIAALMDKEV